MGFAGLIIQVLALATGLLAVALFAKSNFTIMKFRQLTSLGLLALWTGSIDTSKLIIVDKNNKVVEKELVEAIILHKRARIVIYAAVVLNILALIIGRGVL
jgi:hypothetical protein